MNCSKDDVIVPISSPTRISEIVYLNKILPFPYAGGARSLSVFDNDIGSGSISPLIVTGGKSGDVGLHDFRFIATGKTKCNKKSSQQDLNSATMHDNGMLWYIPRAHLGKVYAWSVCSSSWTVWFLLILFLLGVN